MEEEPQHLHPAPPRAAAAGRDSGAVHFRSTGGAVEDPTTPHAVQVAWLELEKNGRGKLFNILMMIIYYQIYYVLMYYYTQVGCIITIFTVNNIIKLCVLSV